MYNLSENENNLLKKYLKERKEKKLIKQADLSIVFDLTYYCNLQCYGCAVNARYSTNNPIPRNLLESSTGKIFLILEKIKKYLDNHPEYKDNFFINFGGGEPLLREDFFEIIKKASGLFGSECVGFDTNGTIMNSKLFKRIASLVSYIGISIDGLNDYHNWWRDPHNTCLVDGCFDTTISNLKRMLGLGNLDEKVEVTSVVTTKNAEQLPKLMRLISSLGVKKYSIHRPMQVGRMADKTELIPNPDGFLKSTVRLLETNQDLKLDFHIHHSLEAIYSSLFLGEDTHVAGKIWCKIGRSSIGIDPWGTVYFCPWCIVEPWTKLSPGNLLQNGTDLESILHSEGGIMDLAKEFGSPHVRCYPCQEKCGRGCPLASAAAYISNNKAIKMTEVNEHHLITGISAIDPACPKYNQYT